MTNAYLPRVVDDVIAERLRSAGAVLLEGPKACGKTRSAQRIAASAIFLDLDEAAQAAIQVDPTLVLTGDPPQLIDEWQVEATRVWNHVRSQVDARQAPGQFILTGSSVPNDDVRRHTGAGRVARITMRPMSLFESRDSSGAMSLAALMAGERPTSRQTDIGVSDIAGLIVRGGWPLIVDQPLPAAAQFTSDYVANICDVDASRVAGVRRDPHRVRRFLQSIARNIATEVKIARIAADVGSDGEALSRATVYDYLTVMRRLMVIEEQPPWAPHLRSRARLRQTSKMHFVDPSLATAALGAHPLQLLADLNYLGLLFESMVLRDARTYSGPLGASLHHYRDSDGLEVDLVMQTPSGTWGAFEVKLNPTRVDAAAASLLRFANKIDTDRVGQPAVLGVVTATGYGYTRADGVVVIPIVALGP
jgi:predicted AAA+ superfamily ATPase